MKHEAEQELLKTLNGQLKELPAVTQTMIQQYQMLSIVKSIFCGIALIITITSTIVVVRFLLKKGDNVGNPDYEDYEILASAAGIFGIVVSVILFIALGICISHACAPIASIVQELVQK